MTINVIIRVLRYYNYESLIYLVPAEQFEFNEVIFVHFNNDELKSLFQLLELFFKFDAGFLIF